MATLDFEKQLFFRFFDNKVFQSNQHCGSFGHYGPKHNRNMQQSLSNNR